MIINLENLAKRLLPIWDYMKTMSIMLEYSQLAGLLYFIITSPILWMRFYYILFIRLRFLGSAGVHVHWRSRAHLGHVFWELRDLFGWDSICLYVIIINFIAGFMYHFYCDIVFMISILY